MHGETQVQVTPVAFLNVFAGAMIGTGWDIDLFNGMGLNSDGTGLSESSSFQGIVTNVCMMSLIFSPIISVTAVSAAVTGIFPGSPFPMN